MFSAIPYVTSFLTLIAFGAALYFKGLDTYISRGANQLNKIGEVKNSNQKSAIATILNVFDIDVNSLDQIQKFELANKVLASKERENSRIFWSLLFFAGIFFSASVISFYMDSQNISNKLADALENDRQSTLRALEAEHIYIATDKKLIDHLSEETDPRKMEGLPSDPVKRDLMIDKERRKIPSVKRMLELKDDGKAPFQELGQTAITTVPGRRDYPPSFHVYVSEKHPLAGRRVSIRNTTDRTREIIVLAVGGITTAERALLIHINKHQYDYLFGNEVNVSPVVQESYVQALSAGKFSDVICDDNDEYSIDECTMETRRPQQI